MLDLCDGYRLRQADASDHAAMRLVCLRTGNAGREATETEDDPDLLGPVPMGYRRQVIGADDRLAPITWADKPFEILTKQ